MFFYSQALLLATLQMKKTRIFWQWFIHLWKKMINYFWGLISGRTQKWLPGHTWIMDESLRSSLISLSESIMNLMVTSISNNTMLFLILILIRGILGVYWHPKLIRKFKSVQINSYWSRLNQLNYSFLENGWFLILRPCLRMLDSQLRLI